MRPRRSFARWLHEAPAPPRAYLVGLSGVLVVSLVIWALDRVIDLPSAAMLYLLPILFVGGRWGALPAIVAALAAFLLHNLLNVEPLGALWPITSPTALYELALLLLVAVATGRLAGEARAAARRQRETEIRSTLLASISHDLRTPLTAIKTSVSTLRDPQIEIPAEIRQELLADVEEEADRLIQLVSNVLILSRLDAGVTPSREWNAVGELIAAIARRSEPLLGDRPLTLDAPDSLPLVRLDATLFDQTLTNLLENAAQHTPPGTPVRIRAEVNGSDLRVEVMDAGPGIPEADRERVFERFSRHPSASNGGSSGLGLAIARAAVEAQGGRLWLEPMKDPGARFVLFLPGVAAQAPYGR